MKKSALIILTCVLFSSKCNALVDVEEKEDCVESCKEESQQERLGGHCYHFSTASKSWHKSKLHCKSKNGHLAAVTNLEIHNFLMKKVDEDDRRTWFWIGGSDKGEEGNWKWTDGSVWNFTNWADQPYKQPNSANEDCLQIHNRYFARNGWNDQNCNHQYRFICSWRICPGIVSPC